jgi:hypothetical protein
MNEKTCHANGTAVWTPSGETRVPGAILALASTAAAVLSVVLLFGYVTGLSDRTEDLEISAQALFANYSAMDFAESMLSAPGGGAGSYLPPVTTAGMVSTFSAAPDSSSSSRSFEIDLPGAEDMRVVRCSGGALAAGVTSRGLSVTFHRTGSDDPEAGFPIVVPGVNDTAGWAIAGCLFDPGILGVVASDRDGTGQLHVIGEGGIVSSSEPDGIWISSSTLITTGVHEGSPAAALSDGSNTAVVVNLNGSAPQSFHSPEGTCPVFLPWGELFGEPGSAPPADGKSCTVTDFFTGDFNQDGEPDVAWAGPSSVACRLSGRNLVILDSVEGSALVAWGFLEGRYGLGGLWESADGELSWRKLLWSGFQLLPAGGVALAGYSGRISSAGGTLAGVRSGRLEYTAAGSSGSPALVFDGGTPVDLDGSGLMDAAVVHDDGITLMPDPGGPVGASLRLTATTAAPSGEVLLTGTRTVDSENRFPEVSR